MQREALRQEYIRLIGYDPFKDDPSMTVELVREILADYKHNVALYGDVTDGSFGPYVPNLYQSRADVDADPYNYPGWCVSQRAARNNW